jgi:hypothetical protein
VHSQLFNDITADFEEASIVQASKLPARFYIANEDKKLRKRWKGSKGVWKHRYIAYATEDYINAIVIDIDSDITIEQILSVLPSSLKPTSIVGLIKKKNNVRYYHRPHVRFNLKTPVKRSSEKQLAWFNSIVEEIQTRLSVYAKVDPKVPTYVTKNPLSGKWDYNVFSELTFQDYDLAELSELLELKRKKLDKSFFHKKQNVINFKTREVVKTNTEVGYRNDDLFNVVRYQAYSLRFKAESETQFHDMIVDICINHNNSFNSPLPLSEVKATAKSIARWTWKNITNANIDNKNRGSASKYINDEDELKKRQQIGALYSHKIRSTNALKTLSEAIKTARADGLEITKKAMSKITGLDPKTIRKYWDQAQNDNVIAITNADYKLHDLLTKRGGIMVSSEKVYLNNAETESNEVKAEENKEQQYSVDIKPVESKLITIRATEIYTSDSYQYIQVIKNDTYDDSCPF